MFREILLSLSILTVVEGAAQNKLTADVKGVTVFLDGAQVSRTKAINVPAGKSTYTFGGLSPYIDAQSLRLTANGSVTIMSVAQQNVSIDSVAHSQKSQALNKRCDDLRAQIAAKENALEVNKSERKFLTDNSQLSGKNEAATLQAIRDFANYYSTRLNALYEQQANINKELGKLRSELGESERELRQLDGQEERREGQVIVEMEAKTACRVQVEFSYFVHNAGWLPLYDIRASSIDKPIELIFKANIYQNTRENWDNVSLTLSSSSPTLSNVAPKLKPYRLNYGLRAPSYSSNTQGNVVSGTISDVNGKAMQGVTVLVGGTTYGVISDVDGKYSISVPDLERELNFKRTGYNTITIAPHSNLLNVTMSKDAPRKRNVTMMKSNAMRSVASDADELNEAAYTTFAEAPVEEEALGSIALDVQNVQTSQGSIEYKINNKYSLNSAGKPLTVEIETFSLPTKYIYSSTPKVDAAVFLNAQISGRSEMTLLDGEANVFFENTFVGKTLVDASQLSDTLLISLGRDNNVIAQRTKESDYIKKNFIGQSTTTTRGWRLTLRNNKSTDISITLSDQIPVSVNSEIEVSAEQLSGGKLNAQTGEVTWQIDLKAGEKAERQLIYKVKSPKNKTLIVE